MSARRAVVAGSTGLVGGYCLDGLLAEEGCSEVHALTRRPLSVEHPKLTVHLVDFDDLARSARLPVVDEAYCCLGTTMRRAGSRDAFERVDLDYVREFAKLALDAGAKQLALVSALGADSTSSIYYNRIKGRAEEAVRALEYGCVHVYRPSLLLGTRSERRTGEQIAQALAPVIAPLLRGPLRRYRPVDARDVATRMIQMARLDLRGWHVHYFPE
jgi:uncharacterized protein YbjT (DUF2867 family)